MRVLYETYFTNTKETHRCNANASAIRYIQIELFAFRNLVLRELIVDMLSLDYGDDLRKGLLKAFKIFCALYHRKILINDQSNLIV